MATVRLRDHNVNATYGYLFDTNVWLYIYGPMASSRPHKQRAYTRLLQDIISRKATLFITSLNISEYINVVLKLGYKQWLRTNGLNPQIIDFKRDYRPTDDYKIQLEDARLQLGEILKVSEKRPDDFNSMDVDLIIHSMDQTADYNDSYLLKMCELRDMKLVTDDHDLTTATTRVTLITE